jgi:hypothetical protein
MEQESLVLVDITNPKTNGARYEVRPPTSEPEIQNGVAISWSNSGEAITLRSIIHISDGKTCALPPSQFFFFGANRVAGLDPARIKYQAWNEPNPWRLLFFDEDCKDAGTWEIPYVFSISDASADRGLLCILPRGELGPSPKRPVMQEVLIVSPSDKRVVQRWNIHAIDLGLLFADSGKALCGMDGDEKHGAAHCWSVDSGKETGVTKGLNIHQPMRTALHAQRAVLSDYGWGIDLEGLRARIGALKRRVIWDFKIGKELASWKPKWQKTRSTKELHEPYKFAISPDGEYVLEGGDGVLALYKIEP